MNTETLNKILESHRKWLQDEDGARADLRGANLSDADLRRAYLRRAYLSGADLRGADLRRAYLSDAYLSGADLTDVKADYTTTGYFLACPEAGSFDGWKKLCSGKIAKLRIPAKAKRSSATTRKCRAERAKVLQIWDTNGESCSVGVSLHDRRFIYRPGEIVKCHEWDNNRWEECGGGIHFFLTRAEAELWGQ